MQQLITRYRILMIIASSSLIIYLLRHAEIAATFFPNLNENVVAVVALIAGSLSADQIALALLRSQGVRRVILGRAFVEGFWFIRTTSGDASSDTPPFERDGVLWIQYLPEKNEVETQARRLTADRSGTFDIISKIAYVGDHGTKVAYLNHFEYKDGGENFEGLAAGHFSGGSRWGPPDMFTTTIGVFGQRGSRTQLAYRMAPADVRALSKRFAGTDWRFEFLKASGHSVAEKLQELGLRTENKSR